MGKHEKNSRLSRQIRKKHVKMSGKIGVTIYKFPEAYENSQLKASSNCFNDNFHSLTEYAAEETPQTNPSGNVPNRKSSSVKPFVWAKAL